MDTDHLLAATWRGDKRAFESLVRSEAARLHGIARRVTGDASLADDVVQETFLRILRVPAAARPSRAAAAWLARVTVRVALNTRSSERARHRREERYATERSREMKDGAPIGAAVSHELDRSVSEALASLSPETRAALWLHVVEGEGVREVAVCLDSSRSSVSRRIRAGVATLRMHLAKSGAALAGVAGLKDALRGSEVVPSEALVQRILEAGTMAMASEPASLTRSDALDDALMTALAAPGRSLRSLAGIGTAAVFGISILAALGYFLFLRPGSDPEGEPVRPVVSAPVVPPSREGPEPKGETKPTDPAPAVPPTETKTAVVIGTVRDAEGELVASARVYLAVHPEAEDLMLMGQDVMLGRYFRADYFQRSRFFETATDAEGRYVFERIQETGEATLCGFKEDHAAAIGGVRIEPGARSEVHLELAEGLTLAGRVTAQDGSPVADAVVSVCQAWSPTNHIFKGAGYGPTDAEGRFRLGLGAKTSACHVRVSSLDQGQHFFAEVQVSEEEVELRFEEPARVVGKIVWQDGTPASGLTVRTTGRFSEPPIPVSRMGMRSTVVRDGLVGEDGSYRIEGLHPQLHHDIFVIDRSLGERAAAMSPLTPRLVDSFRLEPGEEKVWDKTVQKPITVRGHIRTETKGTPLPEAQVGVLKDGKRLGLISVWANEDGFFQMRLDSGPGEYRIHAEPPVGSPSSDPVQDLLAERFGKDLRLGIGEEVELDLTICEPAVVPIRVLDHEGKPVKDVGAILHASFPDGRTMGLDTQYVLDEGGRTAFSFYFPASELWYEIAAIRGGPPVETARHAIVPGTTLPEETVVLPRTCDLTAVLLDPTGKVCSDLRVYVRATYEDGTSSNPGSQTNDDGRLELLGQLRAAPFVLEIRSADSKLEWKSEKLDGGAGKVLDLGKVILSAADE